MRLALNIVQILASAALIGLILLQAKGTGLGSAFGGSGEFYQSKRGVEKIVFNATIGLVILFFIVSLASVLVR